MDEARRADGDRDTHEQVKGIIHYLFMMNEDSDIIKNAQENPEAFERLYRKYNEKIFNFFLFRVGYKREVAEDLVQETFINALKHIGEYQVTTSSYYTYLLRIAHNALVNFYRYTQAHVTVPLDEMEADQEPVNSDVSKQIETHLMADTLQSALEQLTPFERNILFMRFQSQLSIREIAESINKSENAVKLIILRARKKLLATHHFSEKVQ